MTQTNKPLYFQAPDKLCKAMGSLFLQKDYSDVILTINEEKIYAHKVEAYLNRALNVFNFKLFLGCSLHEI